MERAFRIHVEPRRWSRTCHGSIYLTFGHDEGTEHFPSPRWDDFVTVILGWWIRDSCTLATHRAPEIAWSFMDGPYAVRVARRGAGLVELLPEERTAAAHARPSRLVEEAMVLRELSSAAERVVRAYSQHGWPHDRDYQSLTRHVPLLRSVAGPPG